MPDKYKYCHIEKLWIKNTDNYTNPIQWKCINYNFIGESL